MTDLHIEQYGAGEPAVLIHGSGSWGVDTFPAQRELGDEFQVLLMDRRGHGQSPPSAVIGWPTDMHDVVSLLEELARRPAISELELTRNGDTVVWRRA